MREQKAEELVRYTKSGLEKEGLARTSRALETLDRRVSYDLAAGTVGLMTVATQRA